MTNNQFQMQQGVCKCILVWLMHYLYDAPYNSLYNPEFL